MNIIRSICLVLALIGIVLSSAAARAVPFSAFLNDKTPPQERVYKKVGNEELKLFFVAPPVKTQVKRPALVWIHGGAWVAGDAAVFWPHARYFAARGAVAFSLNYRLTKIGGPQIAASMADCKSAMRYIRAHAAELGIDPNRIAVLGDSAGGHLAAALGTLGGFDDPHDDLTVSAVPNALVLFNPILDMTEGDWVYHAALGANPKQGKPAITDAMLGVARGLSPMFHVQPGQPPTLLLQGLDDHVVNPDQARRFAAAMQAAGNRCDLGLWPQTRHAFVIANYTAPETTVVAAVRAADGFLSSLGYLQGDPTLEVSQPAAWVSPTPKK